MAAWLWHRTKGQALNLYNKECRGPGSTPVGKSCRIQLLILKVNNHTYVELLEPLWSKMVCVNSSKILKYRNKILKTTAYKKYYLLILKCHSHVVICRQCRHQWLRRRTVAAQVLLLIHRFFYACSGCGRFWGKQIRKLN